MAYSGSISSVGGSEDLPDYVYYNADIINNTANDQTRGLAIRDPAIRFNETRDTAIIKDASQYYFSIIRFTMDGANRDLPLFIPSIQESVGQTNVNLTVYAMAYSLEGTYKDQAGGNQQDITVLPVPRFIQFIPETQNLVSAPLPTALTGATWRGQWSNATQYRLGDIVGYINPADADQVLFNQRYGSFLAPFYQTITPPQWTTNAYYDIGAPVQYAGVFYVAVAPQTPGGANPVGNPGWTVGPPVGGVTPNLSPYWTIADPTSGESQSLDTRYYWVYTYQAWLDNVNRTIYNPADSAGIAGAGFSWTCCWGDLYEATYQALSAPNRIDFLQVYPTLLDFAGQNPTPSTIPLSYVPFYPPRMEYDPTSSRFSLVLSAGTFGDKISTALAPTTGFADTAKNRTFFNSNMFGLFANFNNIYWNTISSSLPCPFPGFSAPVGYVNEILTTNKYYQNVLPSTNLPANLSLFKYWVVEQDFSSVDSIWSPIGSIVFTSTLLPIKAEATGAPVILGESNIGFSSPTVQSAFQPIITDIAIDTSSLGAQEYKKFIYYAPTAEYRLSDFASSHQDIRNIDIQVFWKNRLDNELYPINMFNLTSVSIKIMFKHKSVI
jgi:hypothetical protein